MAHPGASVRQIHTAGSGAPRDTGKQMFPIDVKELSPRNHDLRARRLCRLKRLVERHDYQVDPEQIARGMIREAFSDEDFRRLVD
ncbi:MAG: hypothetical protein ACYC0L_08490 [Thermoleophilia bacterium]